MKPDLAVEESRKGSVKGRGTLQAGGAQGISVAGSPTVDDIELAQFIYLLPNNKKSCDVTDAITSKAALILGRLSEERTWTSNPPHNNAPIMFDFPPLAIVPFS